MSIYSKLYEIQKEIKPIIKDSENPYFHSKYFDINTLLSELKPMFFRRNLFLLQPLVNNQLQTIIIDMDSEEKISFACDLTKSEDPQKMGSAVTYFRRFSLQSLLSLEAEDTDGNAPQPPLNRTVARNLAPVDEPFKSKVEGETCGSCGQGKIVKNPATGKLFCSEKCWLKK